MFPADWLQQAALRCFVRANVTWPGRSSSCAYTLWCALYSILPLTHPANQCCSPRKCVRPACFYSRDAVTFPGTCHAASGSSRTINCQQAQHDDPSLQEGTHLQPKDQQDTCKSQKLRETFAAADLAVCGRCVFPENWRERARTRMLGGTPDPC